MAATTVQGVKVAVEERASRGLWRDALSRLLRNRPAILGMICITIFVGVAILAPVIAPYDPNKGGLGPTFAPPSSEHLAGLDKLGRDELSRVMWGARVSLFVGIISVIVALAIGGIVGALAGGLGGGGGTLLMRPPAGVLSVPGILLAIGIVAWLGQGLPQIMLAVALTNAPIFARILRGSLLALREAEFVVVARSIGSGGGRILVRHMIPNALTSLIVAATLALATAVIDVAGLGFLGLGPPDPRTAEWGTMLTDSTEALRRAPHLIFAPGIAIIISAIGFNLLGDGLRESLDPRMKR